MLNTENDEAREEIVFTGERYVPSVTGEIQTEHLHRYFITTQLIKDKVVLDIASGEGYGSALMAHYAKRVIGVDIDASIVQHANNKYRLGYTNLEFRHGSCEKIPINDQSIDVVVSFETIEHHDQHEAMMAEIKRVLKPGGTLVISSPNKLEYSDARNYCNPFHVKELYRDEFEKLLSTYFKHVDLLGQRVIYGSSIFSNNEKRSFTCYELNKGLNPPLEIELPPIYDIAVASDEPFKPFTNSFLEQSFHEHDLVKQIKEHLKNRDIKIESLYQYNDQQNQEIQRKNEALENNNSVINDLNDNIEKKASELERLNDRATALESDLDEKHLEIKDLTRQLADKDSESEKNRLAIEDLNRELTEKNSESEKNRFEIENLTRQLAEINSESEKNRLEVENLTRQLAEINSESEKNRLEIENLTRQLVEKDSESEKNRLEIDELSRQLNENISESEKNFIEIENLNRQLTEKNSESEKNRLEAENLSHQLTEKNSESENNRLEIENLNRQIKDKSSESEKKRHAIEKLTRKLAEKDSKLEEKCFEIKNITSDLQAKETEIRNNTLEIINRENLIKNLESEIIKLNIKASEYQKESIANKNKERETERKLENKNEVIKKIKSELLKKDEEIARNIRDIKDYAEKIKESRIQVMMLQSESDLLKKENQEKLQVYRLAENDLKDKISMKELEIGKIKHRTKHLEVQLKTQQESKESLINKIVDLKDEKESLSASLESCMNKQHNLNAQMKSCLDEKESEKSRLLEEIRKKELIIERLQQNLSYRDIVTKKNNIYLQSEKNRVSALINSRSWRMTKPLREFRRLVESPLNRLKCYFQILPISQKIKSEIREALALYYPRLLLASGSPVETIGNYNRLLLLEKPVENSVKPHAITLETSDQPIVSVIIPVYGNIETTLTCLKSISQQGAQAAFEIIVIDDCSTDNTYKVLSEIEGIRLIKNNKNKGFIFSCNAGAKQAKGQYLYFLNNDTEVLSGWLDELLNTFEELPGTGLAGSKLIFPDGRLQEAGGIIWNDGSAWNYGRLQDPTLPPFNYAREVDYCSGASLMVQKDIFDRIGGFDNFYAPAYCEDSDLALKVRELGYRVIYQPFSTVIHHEGVTSGTDLTEGVKANQVINTKKLFDRWEDTLIMYQNPGECIDQAKDRRATQRVLVLDHCTPTPDQDAGSVTVYNLLILFREMGFQVTFIPEDNFLYSPEYTPMLQRSGVEVLYSPYVANIDQHLSEHGSRYELVFFIRPVVFEKHINAVKDHCPGAKILFHTIDLHYLRMEREAELLQCKTIQQKACEMKRLELNAIAGADISIVHSTREYDIVKAQLPEANLAVYPLILSTKSSVVSFNNRKDIVFVGNFQHPPNSDAVSYFINDILPLVLLEIPHIRIFIVGPNPPEKIQNLSSENVIVTGFIKDLSVFLDGIRVSIAPLRFGAGIKGKIGSAMAYGLPTVATSIAVEGMELTDQENILVADSPQRFADKVIQLYSDAALWERISKNCLSFAEMTWGKSAAWNILADILEDLDLKHETNNYEINMFPNVDRPPKELRHYEDELKPAIKSETMASFIEQLCNNKVIQDINNYESSLLKTSNSPIFSVEGFCSSCGCNSIFIVDSLYGGSLSGGLKPNWRERLECPRCRMNNRQRLISTLIKKELVNQQDKYIYLMEQITPIYHWITSTFKNHTIIGSEYLNHEYPGGKVIDGIRHEDVENLSFPDQSIDIILSNDVFEHIPHLERGLQECARVLKNQGVMLATIPFHEKKEKSVIRAVLKDGCLSHLLEPDYHSNPLTEEGSLVFTDIGWDLIDMMRSAGFSEVFVEAYASKELGNLGSYQIIFRAIK